MRCYTAERDAIRAAAPGVPITTNLMGTFKGLDYFSWAREMDVVSWDSYPSIDTPMSEVAMRHDLMRGLKAGQPFMLMEQTPSQQNWQPYNSLKRPGVMRLQSWQAVARGADTVMFFQLRRSRGACEKYHSAVIEHVGHENTRVFREVADLGRELSGLGDTLIDSRLDTRVGIVFDWDNYWAVEMSSGPTVALRYVPQVSAWHEAFWSQNFPVDMVGVEADLSRYDVIVAPLLYMVKPGMAARITEFVRRGGIFLATFFSGLVNETDLVTLGGYPGELRALLGIWVEEIDALMPGRTNTMVMKQRLGGLDGAYECGICCDLLHPEGAEVLAAYGSDFYKGMPCLTRNRVEKGQAWYVSSSPEPKFLHALAGVLAAEKRIEPVLRTVPGSGSHAAAQGGRVVPVRPESQRAGRGRGPGQSTGDGPAAEEDGPGEGHGAREGRAGAEGVESLRNLVRRDTQLVHVQPDPRRRAFPPFHLQLGTAQVVACPVVPRLGLQRGRALDGDLAELEAEVRVAGEDVLHRVHLVGGNAGHPEDLPDAQGEGEGLGRGERDPLLQQLVLHQDIGAREGILVHPRAQADEREPEPLAESREDPAHDCR